MSWQEVRSVQPDEPGVRGFAFAPGGQTVALSMESKVQLWAVQDWHLQTELPISTKAVYGMAFSPDNHWLAVGAADGKIRIWELD